MNGNLLAPSAVGTTPADGSTSVDARRSGPDAPSSAQVVESATPAVLPRRSAPRVPGAVPDASSVVLPRDPGSPVTARSAPMSPAPMSPAPMAPAPTLPERVLRTAPVSHPVPTLPPRHLGESLLPRGAGPTIDRRQAELRSPSPLELPVVVPMGMPGTGWVTGRLLVTSALAGLVLTLHRAAARGATAWDTVDLLQLAMPIGLAAVATAWWAATVAGNARRLGMRSVRPGWVAVAWLLPFAWVGVGVAVMRIEVRAEIDPMPAIAAAGFALAVGIPYAVTADLTRTISRRRTVGGWWATMYAVDLLALGFAWNLVAGGPELAPTAAIGRPWQLLAVQTAVLASLVNVLAGLVLATRVSRSLRDRRAALERPCQEPSVPAWFRTGLVPRASTRERSGSTATSAP